MHGTAHPDEAMQFAVWLNTDRGSINDLIAGGYGWPAASGALKGSALDRADPFFGGQRYNDVFADADRHIDTRWRWIPTTMSLIDTLNTGFTNAVTSPRGSFLDAVRTAQTTTVRDMRRKGLQVVAPPER
jgi:multiple sugar transport system substrate-binding protein